MFSLPYAHQESRCYGFVLHTHVAHRGRGCTFLTLEHGKLCVFVNKTDIHKGQSGNLRLYGNIGFHRMVPETLEFPAHLEASRIHLALYLHLIDAINEALVPFHPSPRLYTLLYQLCSSPQLPSLYEFLIGECLILEEGGYGHPKDIHRHGSYHHPTITHVPNCLQSFPTILPFNWVDLLEGFALTEHYLLQTGLVRRFSPYRHQALQQIAHQVTS